MIGLMSIQTITVEVSEYGVVLEMDRAHAQRVVDLRRSTSAPSVVIEMTEDGELIMRELSSSVVDALESALA